MKLLRLLPPVFLGLFIGGVLGSFFTAGDPYYTIVWSVAIPCYIFAVVFTPGLINRSGPGGAHHLALARVESVQRAGSETAGMQDLDLRLVVAPPKGSAYTTTTRLRVPVERLRDYNAGTVHVVMRPVRNLPDARIVAAPDAAWTALVTQAQQDPSRIPSSSAAPPWETATTTQPGTARPGSVPRARGLALGLVTAAVVAALVLVPAYGSIGRAFTNLARWDLDGGNMVSGRYQQLAVDQIAAVAGHHEFTSINFYPDYVLADGLTAPGASTTDTYEWRYGRAFRNGPELIQPTDLQAELFDASELDFSIIGEVVSDATARSTVQGVDSIYAFVERDRAEEGGEPVIRVTISGAYESASLTYGFDGQLIRAD